MRFLNMHAAAGCAPSRAMLMTGRDPLRTGVLHPAFSSDLKADEITIAKQLQDAGVATGVFGKWNLYRAGGDFSNQAHSISYHGFDEFDCFEGTTIDYGSAASNEVYTPYGYMTNAVEFIGDHSDESFFLFYSMGLPHAPEGPTPFDPDFSGTDDEYFWEMMKYSDWCISNVLAKITAEDIEENTLVIFSGDNGTSQAIVNSFQGVQVAGGKGTDDEKGTRVPFYARWPGTIASNSTYNSLSQFVDIPLTFAKVMGVSMPSDRLIEGRDFYSNLLGATTPHRRTAYSTSQYGYSEYFKDVDYKLDGDGMKSVTNWPFGDELISDLNHMEKVVASRLTILTTNMVEKAYGDTPWGGHTNERVFLNAL